MAKHQSRSEERFFFKLLRYRGIPLEEISKWNAEYPEVDYDYVELYPVDLEYVEPDEIFKPKDIALYVHIPFCKSICMFCHFNKYLFEEKLSENYVKALLKEIEFYSKSDFLKGTRVKILYFGGGTPTAINLNHFSKIFDELSQYFRLNKLKEITVETHPRTTKEDYLSKLKGLGVNRVSIGIQSFNNKFLTQIGATHRVEDAKHALKVIKDIGFEKLGIDLMYALPGQSVSDWLADLEKAIEYEPTSISIYRLTVVENTPLYTRNIGRHPLEIEIEMYMRATEMLKNHGYKPYTAVDFAKKDGEALYVLHVWKAPQGEFLGLGAGAYSYINGWALYNIANLNSYIRYSLEGRPPILLAKKTTYLEDMSRYFVLGVRCLEVPFEEFKEKYGIDPQLLFGEIFKKLVELGLAEIRDNKLVLTTKGAIYVDNVAKMFYTENNKGIPQPAGVLINDLTPEILEKVKKMEC